MITKLLRLCLALACSCIVGVSIHAASIYFNFTANSGDGVWAETIGTTADNPDEIGIDVDSPGIYAYTKFYDADLGTADLWCEANTNGVTDGIYYVGTFPDGGSDIYVDIG